MNCDVLVIGAGVSGLATANELMRHGHEVLIVERQVHIGGNAISSRFDGFLMEHGPSTMNAAVPEGLDFARQLGLASSAIELGGNVRRRYLLDDDKLHGIATHPLGFLVSNYLSPAARLSIMAEIVRARRTGGEEETIHEFVSRRFGTEFSEKVMDPLAAGLFCGDARKLSVVSVFPKLVELEREFGSITRAILAAKRDSQPGRRLFSWPDGIAALPRQLAFRLGDRVRTGTAVKKLRPLAAGFEIETSSGRIRSKAVVLAVQPHVAAALMEKVAPDAATAAGDIAAPSLAVVFLGYHATQVSHPLDGLGYLSTRSPGRIVTGAQFCSTMFTGRAPRDHVSIAAYVGGVRNPDATTLPDGELVPQVEAELGGLLDIEGAPVVSRVRRWLLGLPQYTLGHGNRVATVTNVQQLLPGLHVTGNYIAGVSVANCLKTARQTANAVSSYLEQSQHANKSFVSSNVQ